MIKKILLGIVIVVVALVAVIAILAALQPNHYHIERSATIATDFAFKPQGNQTAVTWTLDGNNNFMGKAFGLFMNLDKMVGADFEKGLAQMKSVAETAAKQ